MYLRSFVEFTKPILINPLTARIFTVFGQFIRGQSFTQKNMGREAPRYPSIQVHKKVKFS